MKVETDLRIIAGALRGKKILAPTGTDTRPTHDRVREAVFSMLGTYFDGGSCLDCFAGTGAMSLEALSRGMEYAFLVDNSREAVQCIRSNIQACGYENITKVCCADFEKAIETILKTGMKFDLVFLDPPYKEGSLEDTLALPGFRELLKPNARIVTERNKDCPLSIPEWLSLFRERKYGLAKIAILDSGADL